MKKVTVLVVSMILSFSYVARADEGMWFLAFLNKNYDEMKKKGFKLTPEDIYSINKTSLKDAVVALDGGSCTAEIISDKGLLLTNHHCGYGEIQAHSTVENDYLKNGFWAGSYAEELPNPGKTVSFLVEMRDVSNEVLKGVSEDMSEKMRGETISKAIEKIQKSVVEGTNYKAQVREMFDGNAYYLFIYEIFKDVRLVGAPPSSIGKFGGDTDNWMWPRHTGDFSLFRIYCAPDGSPAEYSPDNVPYTPKTHLKISLKGVNAGDYAMIMGYPGSTDRYLTSWEVDEVMNHANSIRYKVRTEKLNILKKYMDKDPKVRIQYAAKYAQSANYWKYSKGQNLGLQNLKVIKRKQKFEKKLMKWVKKDSKRKETYGKMFDYISDAVTAHADVDIASNYWFESIYLGSEVPMNVLSNMSFSEVLESGDEKAIEEATAKMKKGADEFFKDYDAEVDKELFIKLYKMYIDNVKDVYHPEFTKTIAEDYDGKIELFADELYGQSIFTDKDRFNKFLESPSIESFENDLAILYTISFMRTYWELKGLSDNFDQNYSKGRRLFVDAFMKMYAEKDPKHLYYPDANSTLRLTYGSVGGYKYDGKEYTYYTTVEQYMAKEDKNNPEFFVTDRMKKLYKEKDWGRYAYPDGVLRVNFLTNNDITGGNSGSPVLNGEGQLIGVAFDGNWEGMSGDIAFEPDYQKTICADIKYVLWVIDKYGQAKRIIDEMDIIE